MEYKGRAIFAGLIFAGTIAVLATAAALSGRAGSLIASTDEAEVCATDGLPGAAYSRAHRVVKRRPVPGKIIDHIVPLALGGADADANIQMQTHEEAAAKDALERFAAREVCRYRRVSLAEAQSWFLGDWRRELWRIGNR